MEGEASALGPRPRRPVVKYTDIPAPKKKRAESATARPKSWTKDKWDILCIKDMRVMNGKRMWLVAWADKDEAGDPYPDSWEPTSCLDGGLGADFLADRAARRLRLVEVDARPLDTLIQRSISQAIMGEKIAGFGSVHKLTVEALTLRDLAVHYFNAVVERFGLEVSEDFDPSSKTITTEARISDRDQVGEYCAFENFMDEEKGRCAIRYGLGRKSGFDIVVAAPISLFYVNNSRTPGTVNFYVEVSTCRINGAYGTLTPPHLGKKDPSLLNSDDYKNKVVTAVRKWLPRSHPLIQAGWHTLLPHQHTLAASAALPSQ